MLVPISIVPADVIDETAGYGLLRHEHAAIESEDRPCEPGILARCRGCRQMVGLCTRSPIDVRAIMTKRWRCPDCAQGMPA